MASQETRNVRVAPALIKIIHMHNKIASSKRKHKHTAQFHSSHALDSATSDALSRAIRLREETCEALLDESELRLFL